MKNIIGIFFFMFLCLSSAQEEKRLALVVGNANYDKGELKNPVNDARLIASTLDSLNFDVILKENLSTKREMTAAIREFGNRRSEYDVAFVYYAGHGIQVEDENFLLPTKEVFEGEFDVLDYGVSVQNIMRYLEAQTNEVNILILDACRDNPFESTFNTTRSLKGSGLAKMPPPTGSLIAFSTDSGQTAPDGEGENSTYTLSLAKNMLLEDTSIDQVFRNVRSEVLEESGGAQRPVEATQLTGKTFYLKPGTFEEDFIKIDRLLLEGKNLVGVAEIASSIISKQPQNARAYSKRGHAYTLLGDYESAISDYERAIAIDPASYSSFLYYINTSEVVKYAGLIDIYSDTEYKNEEKRDYYLEKLYKNGNDNPYYYRVKTYYMSYEQETQQEKDNYEKNFDLIREFQSIDDGAFASYSKEHTLNEKGIDPVNDIKYYALDREFGWRVSKVGRSQEETLALINKMEEVLTGDNVTASVRTSVWFWLELLYKEMLLSPVAPDIQQKFLDGLLKNLDYDNLALKIDSYSSLISFKNTQKLFSDGLVYSKKLLEIASGNEITNFLFERFFRNQYVSIIHNLFYINEDYVETIKAHESFFRSVSEKRKTEGLFFVDDNKKVGLNLDLIERLGVEERYSLYRSQYLVCLSYLLLNDRPNYRSSLNGFFELIKYENNAADKFINIRLYSWKNPNESWRTKEEKQPFVIALVEDDPWWTEINRFLYENYNPFWNNDKNRHARYLEKDVKIGRKIYNLIKGVGVPSDSVLYNEERETKIEDFIF